MWINKTIQSLCLLSIICAVPAAGEPQAEHATHAEATAPSPLDRYIALAGVWEGTATHGEGEPEPATVTYAVTAGGSAVVETEFPGTKHEMVTVYYMVGDELRLTHYCMLANQPTMAASFGDNPDVISFRYVEGTNIETGNEMHMREVDFEFLGPDHYTAKWTSYMDGQPGMCAVLDLKRVQE